MKYLLLKDLPLIPKGTIIEPGEDDFGNVVWTTEDQTFGYTYLTEIMKLKNRTEFARWFKELS